jgi:beta-lactamase class D
MNFKLLTLFAFTTLLFACSPNNVKIDASIEKLLDSAGVEGSFALLENGSGQFTIAHLSSYKDAAYAPLNTFFILPSLMALDKGIINQNPSTWISTDSVAYYQQLMSSLGRPAMIKAIDSIHYGKGVVSANINEFWKDQSLRITADEQLGLIKKMYFKSLPFQKRSQELFKKMISKEDNSNYHLSYIEAKDSVTHLSWVVGFEEENKHIYFFVLSTTGKKKGSINTSPAQSSVTLLKNILLQQGFLQGLR